jgi:two-component system sensor histidine kinase AlgZ
MVFVVVVIAQLFAFLVLLIPEGTASGGQWQDLGLISLFVQWCALASCYTLCMLRPFVCRYSHRVVALVSYLTVLLMVFIVSELAYWYVYPGAEQLYVHWPFVLKNVAIAFILTGPVLRYFYVQHQWRANVRAEAEARLQSLQSRIRPHFFFNSMNMIASLTRTNPEKAEAAVQDLADLFRASLRDAKQFHSFRDELDLCERYLDIEKLRLEDRLNLDWQISDIPLDAYVPPLMIQPLLENAIYHGIEPRTAGGTITIRGKKENNQIQLNIENPLPIARDEARSGNRIAQENIRARLDALFANRGDMQVTEDNDTYRVTVTWPYRNQIDEDTDY